MTEYKKTVPFMVDNIVIREFQKPNSNNIHEAGKVAFNALAAQHVGSVKTTTNVSLKP